uniref:(northern house mosquito) hypothetical protein n=1 Tax=Culex pipiens TaxID=7175 RepID=A0A8D8L783_CULPI
MKFDKDFCRFLYFLLRAFSSAFFLKRKMSSEQSIFFFFEKFTSNSAKTEQQNIKTVGNLKIKSELLNKNLSNQSHTHPRHSQSSQPANRKFSSRLSPRIGSKPFHV